MTRRVTSSLPNDTSTWLSTTSFQISYPARRRPFARYAACWHEQTQRSVPRRSPGWLASRFRPADGEPRGDRSVSPATAHPEAPGAAVPLGSALPNAWQGHLCIVPPVGRRSEEGLSCAILVTYSIVAPRGCQARLRSCCVEVSGWRRASLPSYRAGVAGTPARTSPAIVNKVRTGLSRAFQEASRAIIRA